MQVSLANPPKIFARNATGRMVQIAGRPGEIGKVANLVVPNEREIRRLRPAVTFFTKLTPTPFNYGTLGSQHKRSDPPPLTGTPIQFNRVDNLPLFQKL